ncbi:MAG: AAA family ATPase [Vampirovibrionales bacterium]
MAMTSYTTLEVENFKGIRKMKLEGLGMVNVFVGGNNVGKTSVLQALAISNHGKYDLLLLEDSVRQRAQEIVKAVNNAKIQSFKVSVPDFLIEKVRNEEALSFYRNAVLNGLIAYGFLSKQGFPNENLSQDEEDWFLEIENFKKSFSYAFTEVFNIKLKASKKSKAVEYRYFENSAIPFPYGNNKEVPSHITMNFSLTSKPNILVPYQDNGSYLSSTYFKFADYLSNFEKLNSKKKALDKAIGILKTVEPKLIDIRRSEDKLLLELNGFEERLPMKNVTGEGFSRLLLLLCKIEQFKSKTLFIDEIENGFHYSVQEDMWRMILTAAKEDGTQFFFTTHSYEVLESLNAMTQKIIADWEQEKTETKNYQDGNLLVGENKTPMEPVCVFSLAKSTDDVVTYKRFDKDSLEGAIALQMELRGKGAN